MGSGSGPALFIPFGLSSAEISPQTPRITAVFSVARTVTGMAVIGVDLSGSVGFQDSRYIFLVSRDAKNMSGKAVSTMHTGAAGPARSGLSVASDLSLGDAMFCCS